MYNCFQHWTYSSIFLCFKSICSSMYNEEAYCCNHKHTHLDKITEPHDQCITWELLNFLPLSPQINNAIDSFGVSRCSNSFENACQKQSRVPSECCTQFSCFLFTIYYSIGIYFQLFHYINMFMTGIITTTVYQWKLIIQPLQWARLLKLTNKL